jgi:hypothetical protein
MASQITMIELAKPNAGKAIGDCGGRPLKTANSNDDNKQDFVSRVAPKFARVLTNRARVRYCWRGKVAQWGG